ncbi:hypothetical protein DFJ73DRAFT_559729 [Zopfochytrium polystomum]|nr:hypothetical protein DFJ73DRAFT_559729 [Zopfochytrium polystomum]
MRLSRSLLEELRISTILPLLIVLCGSTLLPILQHSRRLETHCLTLTPICHPLTRCQRPLMKKSVGARKEILRQHQRAPSGNDLLSRMVGCTLRLLFNPIFAFATKTRLPIFAFRCSRFIPPSFLNDYFFSFKFATVLGIAARNARLCNIWVLPRRRQMALNHLQTLDLTQNRPTRSPTSCHPHHRLRANDHHRKKQKKETTCSSRPPFSTRFASPSAPQSPNRHTTPRPLYIRTHLLRLPLPVQPPRPRSPSPPLASGHHPLLQNQSITGCGIAKSTRIWRRSGKDVGWRLRAVRKGKLRRWESRAVLGLHRKPKEQARLEGFFA